MASEESLESDFPSAQGMQAWLEREIADIQKAAELRIKDAKTFVADYASGKISSDQAAERVFEYSERWGDALPGVNRSEGLSDQKILEMLDEARYSRLSRLGLQKRQYNRAKPDQETGRNP